MKSFSPYYSFKKGSCQFLMKVCAQVLVNQLEDYRVYLKYLKTITFYHTCPKTGTNPFDCLLLCLICCLMSSKHCRPRSDAAFCRILSGSTLFAQACLSTYGKYGKSAQEKCE